MTLSPFRPSPPTARCWSCWTARCPGIANQRQPNGRILTFPAVSSLLDEDARLCSLSVFDAFRLLRELVTVPANEREAMFFGGLFAYDLVAGFEDLPPCRATPPARTTASIWRRPCWSSTIRPSIPASGASLFTPLESEKQRLEQRLSQLRQQLNEPPAPLPVTTVAEMRCDVDQSDEEYGAVVRKCSARSAPGKSSRWSLPPLLAALPVAAGRV